MATLSQYLQILRNLIQSPTAPVPLLSDALLKVYINIARKQVAIDGECIRGSAAAPVGAGVVAIPITALTAAGFPGFDQAIVVRNARLNGLRVDIRPWDWFENYYLNGPPNPPVLPENVMSHQGQGQFSNLYLYSPGGGQLEADVVFLPIDLTDDATPDYVPYPWTDGVPFYAAWYSYMTLQRQADATQMFFQRYQEVMRRARTTVTSTALPENDPGGIGAALAATHQNLGAMPAAPQQGGR